MLSKQNFQITLQDMESWPFWSHVSLGLLGLFLVALSDYLTGVELHVFIFYALPIAYVSWFLGRRYGIMIVVASGLLFWLINHYFFSQPTSTFVSTWNLIVRLVFFVLVSQGMGSLNKSYKNLKQLAETDILTGLKNRRVFFEQLEIAAARSQRSSSPLTIAYLDLDYFKQVNDNLGHHVGDELLQTVAQSLLNTLRKTDLAARLGGDEFALYLEGNQPEQAQIAAKRLQKALLQTMHENHWPVTFSIGMVTYLKIPDNPKDMIQRADQLMYEVKRSGRGAILAEVFPKDDATQ